MRERRGALCGVLALTLLIASSWDGAVRAADDANPCALPGYSGDEAEGLGGTGLGGDEEDSGIGGTGFGDEADGLGGTGIGIFGTITRFGSICVNGLRIAYTASTPTAVNGVASSAEGLELGQVVAVRATSEAGELRAEHIAVREIVRGALEAVDVTAGELRLVGQRVVLAEPGRAAAFAVGEQVTVSGQRRSDGAIVATHVAAAGAADEREGRGTAEASLIGVLEISADGAVHVAGTEVAPSPGGLDLSLNGEEVFAIGSWNAAAQRLDGARLAAAAPFDASQTSVISVGGYVRAIEGAEPLRVGSFRVDAASLRDPRVRVGDYIVVRGVLGRNGIVRADRRALQVRPPRISIPRPPPRADRPKPDQRIDIVRPTLVPKPAPAPVRPPSIVRPPALDLPVRPVVKPQRPH